jgi:hypothetical protein
MVDEVFDLFVEILGDFGDGFGIRDLAILRFFRSSKEYLYSQLIIYCFGKTKCFNNNVIGSVRQIFDAQLRLSMLPFSGSRSVSD